MMTLSKVDWTFLPESLFLHDYVGGRVVADCPQAETRSDMGWEGLKLRRLSEILRSELTPIRTACLDGTIYDIVSFVVAFDACEI